MPPKKKSEEKPKIKLPKGVQQVDPEYYIVTLDHPFMYGDESVDKVELRGPYTMEHLEAAEGKLAVAAGMAMAGVWMQQPIHFVRKLRPADYRRIDTCMQKMMRESKNV